MKLLLRKCRGLLKRIRKSYVWSWICYHCRKTVSHEYIAGDADTARKALLTMSPKPSGSPFAENRLAQNPEYDLQIIIPAYNVESYLARCLESILNQPTKYRFQVIVVNDGSRDKTGEIAGSFTDPRVRVIHQKNGGASVARNAALKYLNAKYIMFVDADDWIFDGSIDALMDVAMEKDAQIVQGGYHCQEGDRVYAGLLYPAVKKVENPVQLYGFPVGKVYKSSLWQGLQFPEGFWFEDTVLSFLLFPRITNAWLIPQSVYVYRQNEGGSTFTARAKPKSVDAYWVTEMLMDARETLGLQNDARFQRKFFGQILLNAQRIVGMPDDIRKSVFVLTCYLHDRYFAGVFPDAEHRDLKKAMEKRDYGLFRLYSNYHSRIFRKG